MVHLHLPPGVKQLLTLRNPNPLPSSPAAKLRQLFADTHRAARTKNAETGWLVLTTCAILTANRPSAMADLYRFVASPGSPHNVNRAALMRESALKSGIFVGVPRVILSLAALHEELDDDVRAALRKESRRIATSKNIDSITTRGRSLWDSIYAPHADKLYAKLGSYHPDFISFIIQSYGTVLSPLPGETRSYSSHSGSDDRDQGNLSRALGSVVGIACLRAEERVLPQLTSHVFGLLKARHEPNLNDEDRWLSSDEGTEWVLRTVDVILDGVTSEETKPNARL